MSPQHALFEQIKPVSLLAHNQMTSLAWLVLSPAMRVIHSLSVCHRPGLQGSPQTHFRALADPVRALITPFP